MNAPSLTVLKLIKSISERLEAAGLSANDGFGHGTQTAFDEAAWLVMWRLGLPLDDLDGVAERPVSAEESQRVDELVASRISSRLPAAYLTREAWLQAAAQELEQFDGGRIVSHLLQRCRRCHQFVGLEVVGLDAKDAKHELGGFDAAAQLALGDGEVGERRQGFRGSLAGVLEGILK